MRLLVVEDYAALRRSLVKGLSEAGFAVDATGDGQEGLWYARDRAFDVIILDLMLPGMDGRDILRTLRRESIQTPVLVLTARDAVEDRVAGLRLGADDYLVKPFAFDELLARVHALIRRAYEAKAPVLRIADLEINRQERAVRRAGRTVHLTGREFDVLELLALRAGRVVSRADIEGHLYSFDTEPSSNVIEVLIRRLRVKLEAGGMPRLLRTRTGAGYVLQEGD